jgi:outer membrane protein OmpA-like peptidoglycan-associated protein
LPRSVLDRLFRVAVSVALMLSHVRLVAAQDARSAFHVRTAAAGALMLNHDQRSWLQYEKPGILADIQLAYTVLPWLDVQLGATGGLFLSHEPGGLLSPMLGVLGRFPMQSVTPYALLDFGLGITGSLLRPFLRAGLGLDFEVSRSMRLGPNLGLGVVTQVNGPEYSSDGLYAFLGLAFSYWPVDAPPAFRQSPAAPPPAPTSPLTAAAPVRAAEPAAPPTPPAPPSPELSALLDRALPTQQSELLAPVLFGFDSDVLEASGIAMLHEVARVLSTERADVELVEIAAYADARGESDHNHQLAARRAQRVLDWLVQHGIAQQRLQVSAQGAVDFVESGDSEGDHAQNRRVVFRIMRARRP